MATQEELIARRDKLQAVLDSGVREKFYPDDNKHSGFIYTDAPEILLASEYGAHIAPQGGQWLLIPTDACPRRGDDGRRANPNNLQSRFGELRFVPLKPTRALLVADETRVGKSGRATRRAASATTKSGQYRAGLATVVLFLLVRKATIPAEMNVRGVFNKAPEFILRRLGNLPEIVV